MINIVLIDDHDLVRDGIKRLLADATDIRVIGDATNGDEGIKLASKLRPDVILLDIKMPGIDGLDVTRKLIKINNNFKIIALSTYECEVFPLKVMEAGAVGYITKGATSEEMIQAIHMVSHGQSYVSPLIANQLALKHLHSLNRTPFDDLSSRELQVAIMVAQGSRVVDISKRLRMSTKTVNSYRYRIFEKLKLQIKNDVGLTHMAVQYGLIKQGDKTSLIDVLDAYS